tara:strand:- start:2871 stop:3257 length:387 start_codon:yes stop_codon:yes gene_type:complete
MKPELKDWLNSINYKKNNIFDDPEVTESMYPAFIVNKCMSGHMDAVLYANEMNIYNSLDKRLQYDFLLNILRSRKRFSPWIRKEELDNLELIKKYYRYSDEKAKQVLSLLTEDQLNFIRTKLDTGGLR